MVPGVIVYIKIDNALVTLTLSWGEPFNNLDPIVNYTVSCSGDVTCPPNFTTPDNATRSYTITNLALITRYIFSVAATNSFGSGEADVVMITIPGKFIDTQVYMYAKQKHLGCKKSARPIRSHNGYISDQKL